MPHRAHTQAHKYTSDPYTAETHIARTKHHHSHGERFSTDTETHTPEVMFRFNAAECEPGPPQRHTITCVSSEPARNRCTHPRTDTRTCDQNGGTTRQGAEKATILHKVHVCAVQCASEGEGGERRGGNAPVTSMLPASFHAMRLTQPWWRGTSTHSKREVSGRRQEGASHTEPRCRREAALEESRSPCARPAPSGAAATARTHHGRLCAVKIPLIRRFRWRGRRGAA